MQKRIPVDTMAFNLPIAMAYVPMQKAPIMYENLEDAFKKGTIFPELDKPFFGKRGQK
ncbi:MAG: spore coat associated protein CotJA [Lachnospiraceae bacterium]|nr:spore coat associated protein CotJA [Lachnospiraceae bacterium]